MTTRDRLQLLWLAGYTPAQACDLLRQPDRVGVQILFDHWTRMSEQTHIPEV